ncbi:MAG: hypothetical protein P4K97_07425, partial [Terracidiphilus sp.]|nr:hypothetical protein [Terracidiphilus sp.]
MCPIHATAFLSHGWESTNLKGSKSYCQILCVLSLKLNKGMPFGFVTGHDFSRAVTAIKSKWALHAAEKLVRVVGRGFNPDIN